MNTDVIALPTSSPVKVTGLGKLCLSGKTIKIKVVSKEDMDKAVNEAIANATKEVKHVIS